MLTSPSSCSTPSAWDDVSRVQRLARAGWLGFEHDHATPLAFADRLWEALGPFLLVAVAGLVVALLRRSRADLVLASFVVAYAVYLLPVDAHFDRYVLPLVPVLGAFGGLIRPLRPLAAVLLVVPLVWSVADARDLTRTDTRELAAAWILAHVPHGRCSPPIRPRSRCPTGTSSGWSCRGLDGPPIRIATSAVCAVPALVVARLGCGHRPCPRRARATILARPPSTDACAARAPAYEALPGRDGLAGPWVRLTASEQQRRL